MIPVHRNKIQANGQNPASFLMIARLFTTWDFWGTLITWSKRRRVRIQYKQFSWSAYLAIKDLTFYIPWNRSGLVCKLEMTPTILMLKSTCMTRQPVYRCYAMVYAVNEYWNTSKECNMLCMFICNLGPGNSLLNIYRPFTEWLSYYCDCCNWLLHDSRSSKLVKLVYICLVLPTFKEENYLLEKFHKWHHTDQQKSFVISPGLNVASIDLSWKMYRCKLCNDDQIDVKFV